VIDVTDARRIVRFADREFMVGMLCVGGYDGPDVYGADFVTDHADIQGSVSIRIYPESEDVPYWIEVRSPGQRTEAGLGAVAGRETFIGVVGGMMDGVGLGGFRVRSKGSKAAASR
jgi:hypothetical protein